MHTSWVTSEFKRGQIVGARLASASVTKTQSLCDVSRATVSRVTPAYHQEGRTTSNRINCGHKRKLSERDVRMLNLIVSKKHKTTAVQITAELNVHLNSPVSTRNVRQSSIGSIYTAEPNLWSLMPMPNMGFNGARSANLGLWTM